MKQYRLNYGVQYFTSLNTERVKERGHSSPWHDTIDGAMSDYFVLQVWTGKVNYEIWYAKVEDSDGAVIDWLVVPVDWQEIE